MALQVKIGIHKKALIEILNGRPRKRNNDGALSSIKHYYCGEIWPWNGIKLINGDGMRTVIIRTEPESPYSTQ